MPGNDGLDMITSNEAALITGYHFNIYSRVILSFASMNNITKKIIIIVIIKITTHLFNVNVKRDDGNCRRICNL